MTREIKTTLGTQNKTSYISDRRKQQHKRKRLDKELDQLIDWVQIIVNISCLVLLESS